MVKLNSAGGVALGEWLQGLGDQVRDVDGNVVLGPELLTEAKIHIKNGAANHQVFDSVWAKLEGILQNNLLRTARF